MGVEGPPFEAGERGAARRRGPGDLFLVLLLAAAACMWLPSLLRSSLWLDEAGTYWVVKDGPAEAIGRSLRFQGQSPLYYLIEWVAVALGGAREVVLRTPSVLAAALATYLVYRLGRRLLDGEAGLLAAIVLAGSPSVAFAAGDARPYALGLAASVGAVLALIRWVDRGRAVDGAAYVALAILTVYLHYLFATTLLIHAIYALHRSRRGGPVSPGKLSAAGLLVGLLLLPAAGQLSSLVERRGSLAFAETPPWGQLLGALAPPLLVGTVLVGLLRARAARGRPGTRPSPENTPVILLATWNAVPPLILFGVSRLSEAKVFLPQYFIVAAPGLALLAGWTVRVIQRAMVRRIVAAMFVGVTVAASSQWGWRSPDDWRRADWRAAAESVRSLAGSTRVPVLVHGGFVESREIAWLSDPERRSYLLAALALYPFAGQVIPTPYVLDQPSRRYLERLAATMLEQSERFLLVAHVGPDRLFRAWLDGRLGPSGFASRIAGRFGGVVVIAFDRQAAPDGGTGAKYPLTQIR